MIIEYHRPTTLSDALNLLARKQPLSYPLAGGTFLNRGVDEHIAVVDLQALGMDSITKERNYLRIGATTTLQSLSEVEGLSEDIIKAIQHEATYNLRQVASVAGKLVTASGRSPFATSMLALDASLEVLESGVASKQVKIGDWFPLRESFSPGKLISKVSIPFNVRFAYEYISRTPADLPIVCVAVTQWNNGRTRMAIGGWGKFPNLVLDGPGPDGIDVAAKNAYCLAEDEWASAEYRQEMARVLAVRCLDRIYSQKSE
jgi:CO/xanthine dehydrogenase FAD-binding subunit